MEGIMTAPGYGFVELSWPELEHAWDVGLRQRANAIREGQAARYGASAAPGDALAMSVLSCGPELAVAKWTGEYWRGPEPYDPLAADVGRDIQVRSTDRANGCLICHQCDADEHRFFLVVGTMPAFRVVGHILGRDAKRPDHWRTDVSRPAFFVPQYALTAL